jgi:hypothetical protein
VAEAQGALSALLRRLRFFLSSDWISVRMVWRSGVFMKFDSDGEWID